MTQNLPELSLLSGQDEVNLVRLFNGNPVSRDNITRLSYSGLACPLGECLTERGVLVAKAVQKKWKEGSKKTVKKPALKIEDIEPIEGADFEEDFEIEYED